MAKTGERINLREGGYVDAWLCLCGNHANLSGFYPCTAAGVEVEPTPEAWGGIWYRCDECGRVIDQRTGAVRHPEEATT
jgi:hypothetical protein